MKSGEFDDLLESALPDKFGELGAANPIPHQNEPEAFFDIGNHRRGFYQMMQPFLRAQMSHSPHDCRSMLGAFRAIAPGAARQIDSLVNHLNFGRGDAAFQQLLPDRF